MRVAPAVELTEEQRTTLEQWAGGRSLPARLVERARMILAAAAGRQDVAIAAELGISNQKGRPLAKTLPGKGLGGIREGRPSLGAHANHYRSNDQEDHQDDDPKQTLRRYSTPSRFAPCKCLNNEIEQDHRTVKKRVWLAKGYGFFQSAWRTIQGIETVHMIRKGRVRWLTKYDASPGLPKCVPS